MKYSTYPDKLYRKIYNTKLTKEEFESELLGTNWGVFTPNCILAEIATSIVRQDVEPRFLTFKSFSNFGEVAENMFTDQNYCPLTDTVKQPGNTSYDAPMRQQKEK